MRAWEILIEHEDRNPPSKPVTLRALHKAKHKQRHDTEIAARRRLLLPIIYGRDDPREIELAKRELENDRRELELDRREAEPNDQSGEFCSAVDRILRTSPRLFWWNDLPNFSKTPRRGYFVEYGSPLVGIPEPTTLVILGDLAP